MACGSRPWLGDVPLRNFQFLVGDAFSSPLNYLRPSLGAHIKSPLPRETRDEPRDAIPGGIRAPYQPWTVPRGLDPSFMNNVGVPMERLANAVRDLGPFISKCELLRKGDLEVTGSDPISSGDFANIRAGKRNGNCVVIKSFRYNSSSICLPTFLASDEHCRNAFDSPGFTDRDYIKKR